METYHKKDKFTVLAWIVLLFGAFACIAPFVLMISASFTSEDAIIQNGYGFWPSIFSTAAYQYLSTNASYLGKAYGITIVITAVGTTINLFLTTTLAYPLSRRNLPGRNVFNFLVLFVMLFNGGLVPTYLNYTEVFHIKNTFFALLVPTALLMSAFNVMLTRSYFTNSISDSIIEAAHIDGASEFRTFWNVVAPLSKPIIATVGMFVGVAYWNDWYNGMIYVTDKELFNIQNVLNQMLTNIQFLKNNADLASASTAAIPSSAVRMAIAVVAVAPILMVYPFFQKYFVKGISLGGVKE